MDEVSQPAVEGAAVQPDSDQPPPSQPQPGTSAGAGGGAVQPQPVLDDPWPHVGAFFKFVKADFGKRTAEYLCLQCRPKKVSISAHLSSLFNLKSHVKRAHATKSQEFDDLVSLGSRRGKHEREREKKHCFRLFLSNE